MGHGEKARMFLWFPLETMLPQDAADFEWVMWFTSFRNVIIFALSGHVLFAKICSMTVPQVSRGCKAPRGALGSPGEFWGEAAGWQGEKGMENSPS